MNRAELEAQIEKKQSVLCVGLDTDLERVPKHLLHSEDPIFEFNKAIIDATHQFAVAYKPNLAFYEAHGIEGWQSLTKTIEYLNHKHPEVFTIADAKRGDIGNTSKRYAEAFFNQLNFDSITVAPYMGIDSVQPFLDFEDKWAIVLGLTSNAGALQFQFSKLDRQAGEKLDFLFEKVLQEVSAWGHANQMMFVIGATKAEYMQRVRKVIPDHFLLVPGVGAQGGSLQEVLKYGKAQQGIGLLVNSSRGIIYKDSTEAFAEAARQEAQKLQHEMQKQLFT